MVEYWKGVTAIEQRHAAETLDDVAALRRKYDEPVFGKVRVWKLVQRLSQCIDPSDGRLFGASQQVHVLQMLEAMARDKVASHDLILAALIHDVGKTLLLTDEDPANITCMNTPIGDYEPGIGLDNVTMQWGHDEFAYSRLVEHLPDHLAWLVRYHSIEIPVCLPLMDARDREYFEKYLRVFAVLRPRNQDPVPYSGHAHRRTIATSSRRRCRSRSRSDMDGAPFWSVMIPTYRTDPELLRVAIESVVECGLGADAMEIVVVNDGAPGDVAAPRREVR